MSSSPAAASILYLGLDVHKDSVTIAVLPADAKTPTRIDQYPNDVATLRRVFERHAKDGEIRACYEASGAGYVLQRDGKRYSAKWSSRGTTSSSCSHDAASIIVRASTGDRPITSGCGN